MKSKHENNISHKQCLGTAVLDMLCISDILHNSSFNKKTAAAYGEEYNLS